MDSARSKKLSEFKPSIFQKIFWVFWPTRTYLRWKEYKEEVETCQKK